MKPLFTTLVLLTVSPITACAALNIFGEGKFGTPFSFIEILVMSIFGIITVPLWFTYIPAIIFTPIAFNNLSKKEYFSNCHILVFILCSIIVGAIIGAFILSPATLLAMQKPNIAMIWLLASFCSGAVTFTLIALCYRLTKLKKNIV